MELQRLEKGVPPIINGDPPFKSMLQNESEAGEVSRVFGNAVTMIQALEGLVSYSLGGRNPVAELNHQLIVAPDYGGMPVIEGLLPLRLSTASAFLVNECTANGGHSLAIALAVGVVNALHFLYAGGNADKPAAVYAVGSLGVAHKQMLRHFFSGFTVFSLGDLPDFEM